VAEEAVSRPDRVSSLGSRLASSRLAPALRTDQPLAPCTTYRVGGPARLWVVAHSLDDLKTLARVTSASAGACREPLPVLVIGRGSNLLVADSGFDGLAVMLGPELRAFDLTPPRDGGTQADTAERCVTAGGGALLPVLARSCAAAGLRGFEWAVGVPGTVGGAVRMNAGCHGSDMAAVLTEATIVDLRSGSVKNIPASALRLGYRTSSVGSSQVVASARIRLANGDSAKACSELAQVVRWRRAHQPGGRNCGSVFANPPGDSAGRLIEAAGAKGLRLGTARVSDKHANFIQADDGGCAHDILRLMTEIRRRVRDAHGVSLVPETCLAGFTRSEAEGLFL